MLRPKLVLLLTEIFQYYLCLRNFYSSEIPEVTWYEPPYNKYQFFY